ncbi:hypothetical protein HPB49_008631 [Dermacentor silvarum]|uniref:Uncharacterized protein n=2 Tax=Dermacentor silvarum TaxID=543639 RepID=A0ACB8CJ51_DERSI|nr:hypothetical protein HPB49_001318 [Dermacentor silvarum]KAH7945243.1 hypothetical protein HPB49_008631 [Dermacentor silvarum]
MGGAPCMSRGPPNHVFAYRRSRMRSCRCRRHLSLHPHRYTPKDGRSRYTRNLVDEGNGKFNLMILCWSEGQGSSIHDHADSHCFMKVLAGTLKEVRFDWPQTKDGVEAPMTKKGDTELQLNSVAYINDSLGLHRVENPSHCEPAVSLHLYCPPFDECSMFDQRTGHRSKSKVTFWSKYGQRTPFVITPSQPEQYENN